MRVLVACEESGIVRDAFRALGHDAWSCDLLPTSSLGPHLQKDALKAIREDGPWDLIIAHPPCTRITNTAVQWLRKRKGRFDVLSDDCEFFRALLESDCPRIAVENPIPHFYAVWMIGRSYDQIFQPYHFGHREQKATCLWLKNLPPLKHTSDLKAETLALPKPIRQRLHYLPPSPDRAMLRSKTYPGIAAAMAAQWGVL